VKPVRATVGFVAVMAIVGCSQPDTPSNAAIEFLSALRAGENEAAAELVCAAAVAGRSPSELAADSWGPFQGIAETPGGPIGVNSEYTAEEELDLTVSDAWVDYEFRSSAGTASWRLHMVNEEGDWKVCDAELLSD
jgi:hypothetical protein